MYNRQPHDHNRDYIKQPIYASTRALKDFIDQHRIEYAFDFHSPWHMGGGNDLLFFVRKDKDKITEYERLGKILSDVYKRQIYN